MESRAIFAQTLGVQEGLSIVYLLSALNTLSFFFGVQVPYFPYRTGGMKVYPAISHTFFITVLIKFLEGSIYPFIPSAGSAADPHFKTSN